MHNRPDNARRWGSAASRAPAGSGLRLALLFAAIAIPMLVIGARAAWLQTAGRERFTAIWDRETERFEPIPARTGRLLTADGQVLAFDEPRFAVAVHYRWLEDPPDVAWLKSQALSRLDSKARRDAAQVDAAKAGILAERDAMHISLATASGLDREELTTRFRVIQDRVERVVSDVETRQRPVADEAAVGGTAANWEWRSLWELVHNELTTPPQRPQRDPIVVAEELQYHEIIPAAALEVIGQIQSFPRRFPGVDVRLTTRRRYPQGDMAAHLIGVRTPLRVDEAAAKSSPTHAALGYRVGEPVGRAGLELACDSTLHGVAGLRRVVTNRQGEILRQEIVRPPVNGRDVVLSLDGRLQHRAESLLDAVVLRSELPRPRSDALTPDTQSTASPQPLGGCLIAIDVRTGELLAAAASPRFDVQLLVSATQAEWETVANDPRRPFFPRVTQAALPPGSIFKTVTAIAGLEAGLIDPAEQFECQGYLERHDRERCAIYRHFNVGHGPMTLDDALAQSCNVYFYDVARRLGPEPIIAWAQRFGCGISTGCELPGERAGNLPQPGRTGSGAKPWYPGTTRQLAVGQAALTMTPLQVVRMMAAIANDGWLVSPHMLRPQPRGVDEQSAGPTEPIQLAGLELDSLQADVRRPIRVAGLSPATLGHIRRGLVLTVEHPRGTGRDALLKGTRIAGKTGTAEIGGGRPDHAWFAGYAPADAPRIAFVVVLEQGGSGGRVAAPLAREFVQTWAELGTQPQSSTAAE
jgi:penicillin-binding protein 2